MGKGIQGSVDAYRATFTRLMRQIIKEIGTDSEIKNVDKILILGEGPPPKKKPIHSKDSRKWEELLKLYPKFIKKVYERYLEDEERRNRKDPERDKNPVTLENYKDTSTILEKVKQMPPKSYKNKLGKKNGGRTEQDEIVEKDRVFVLSEDKPKECENIPYAKEKEIEDLLEEHIEVLESGVFIVGTQVRTKYEKRIDLLAMDKDANLVIIELKKKKTPRTVLAQTFEYYTWVQKLKREDITDIAEQYQNHNDFNSIEDKFIHHFNKKPPSHWNSKQKLIIVGEQIDAETKDVASSLARNQLNVICAELNAYENPQGTIVVVRYIPLQS
tara:strand:+ start:86 stop:1072 length:987 start_codon:yes stop_codon:yes gene_type:complete